MKLYNYSHSSTSSRVRIALALKGVDYEYVAVNLRAGEQRDAAYKAAFSPIGGVPVLEFERDGERVALSQSLAIIDYLDAAFPEPRLVPVDPIGRARVLEIANLISCDIHPVNNLRVLRFLLHDMGVPEEKKDQWYAHWIAEGLGAAEQLLERYGRPPFCFGDAPTLADCCLIPQVGNARRMKCDVSPYPRVMAVYDHAIAHPAFAKAALQAQPDFVA